MGRFRLSNSLDRQKWQKHHKSRKRQRPRRLPEVEKNQRRSGRREKFEINSKTCVYSTSPHTTKSSRKCLTTRSLLLQSSPVVPPVLSWTPVTVSPTVSPSTRVTLSPTPSS